MLELKLDEKIQSLCRRYKLAYVRFYRTGRGQTELNQARKELILFLTLKHDAELMNESVATFMNNLTNELDDELGQMTFAID